MKLALGDALPVGMSSEGEYGDVRLRAAIDPSAFVERVNAACPAGVHVTAATKVEVNAPSLTSKVEAASYRVRLGRLGITADEARAEVEEFLSRDEVVIEKRVQKKRGYKVTKVDVRALVKELEVEEADGEAVLRTTIGRRAGNLGRPKELLIALFDLNADQLLDVKVHKLESFVEFDERLVPVGLGWDGARRFDPWAGGGNGFVRRRKRSTPAVPAGR